MGSTDFAVRPAKETDVPEMLRLWRQMMDFHAEVDPRLQPRPVPQGEQAWESFIREHLWIDDDWCAFVALRDRHIVGHIVGTLRDRYPVFEPAR